MRFLILSLTALPLLALAPTTQQLRRPDLPLFAVAHVSPSMNALNVPRSTSIAVTFNLPIDVVSLSNAHVAGRWSGVTAGSLSLSNLGRTVIFTPTSPFSAGELVTISLSRAVSSIDGQQLGRAFTWSFWVDSRASSYNFTLADTLIPGETPYGAYGGDLDHDGDLDLCIPNEDTSDVSVFLNGGTGNYGPETAYAAGLHCSANEGVDLDADGNTDLAVANILDHDASILFGNGDGTFVTQQRHAVGLQPRGLTVLDVEGDGDPDVVTANRQSGDMSLIINQGGRSFAPEARFAGGVSGETGVAASDMNNDGMLDLVVIGHSGNSISVLLGDGLGGFDVHHVRSIGSNPWMVVTGDVNGDGFMDSAAALSGASAAGVVLNDGTGRHLAPTTYSVGSFPIAIDLGDLDGDGDLDMTASSFSGGDFTVYANDGSGNYGGAFSINAILTGSCTVLHDFDGDGDVDITGLDEIADRVFLFRQDG